ncbi:hypothetical protein FEM48_Zijuj05G0039500 [Ziziphus jujuba var. spinosa]|uniref:Uncharacterized protein n=1 Tax=Ziziphus jujuba var. spinosa TaxID=714518 RepID=A0A978VCP5_ZIZJJ|nr:hypothetical protein FEM48_Zijuj05G0039500 [Ziziphus jujuba var. spinosa]
MVASHHGCFRQQVASSSNLVNPKTSLSCLPGLVPCGAKPDAAWKTPATSIVSSKTVGPKRWDYYEVSFKNGYNLPIIVAPVDSRSGGDDEHNYATTGCAVNLTSSCLQELQYNDESLGCKSACQAFGEPSYCLSNYYIDFFKEACPRRTALLMTKLAPVPVLLWGMIFTSFFVLPLQTQGKGGGPFQVMGTPILGNGLEGSLFGLSIEPLGQTK